MAISEQPWGKVRWRKKKEKRTRERRKGVLKTRSDRILGVWGENCLTRPAAPTEGKKEGGQVHIIYKEENTWLRGRRS